MKPKKFKGSNITFAENQPEYQPLPAFRANSPLGEVVTCWQPTFMERLHILFKGEVWVSMLTFNQPITPLNLFGRRTDILSDGNDAA